MPGRRHPPNTGEVLAMVGSLDSFDKASAAR
jgi:hypothetical protein